MSKLVEGFNQEYFDLNTATYNHECYARLIGFIISFVVFFVIIPLKVNECQTLMMKKFDLAYVNFKNGYYLKKYKVVLRYVISLLLPLIGFVLATKYSIVILILGYILIDYLLMLFSKDNLNISDSILRIETCKLSESLLFADIKDEKAYLETEEGKKVTDDSFVKTLESAEEIIVSETK
jgi:hypothetical protein